MTEVPKRYIIGARVSTDEQAKEGVSLSHQLDLTRAKVAELGGIVAGECVEAGVSGSLYESRADLQRALEAIDTGAVDGMVWFDLSRMSRDIEFIQVITKRVSRAGGELHFCKAEYAETAHGFLQRGIEGVVGQFQRLSTKELARENRRKAIRSGRQTQRSIPPLGYRIVSRDDVTRGTHTREDLGHYEVIPEQAEIVKIIFDRYAAGDSLRAVCRHLHALGIPTPKGRRPGPKVTSEGNEMVGPWGREWLASSVRVILTNTAYYGRASFGKTRNVQDDSRKARGFKRDTQKVKMDPKDWLWLDCPPIVDRDLWEACNQRLNESKTLGAGRADRRHLLTGLLRCPRCHRAMMGQHKYWKNEPGHGTYTRYKCRYGSPSDSSAPGVQCWNKSFRGDQIEPQIIDVFLEIVNNPATLEKALSEHADRLRKTFSEGEYNRLKRELAELDKRMQAAVEAQIAASMKGIDATVYEAVLQKTSEQRVALRESIEKFESRRKRADRKGKSADVRAKFLQDAADDVSLILHAPEVAVLEKHKILARLIESIYPQEDGGLRIVFRLGAFEPLQRWVWFNGEWEIVEVESKAI